jgi:hypothetical protein
MTILQTWCRQQRHVACQESDGVRVLNDARCIMTSANSLVSSNVHTKCSRTEMVLNRNCVMDVFCYITEKTKLFSNLLTSRNG